MLRKRTGRRNTVNDDVVIIGFESESVMMLRPEAKEGNRRSSGMRGIRVVMITGDHRLETTVADRKRCRIVKGWVR